MRLKKCRSNKKKRHIPYLNLVITLILFLLQLVSLITYLYRRLDVLDCIEFKCTAVHQRSLNGTPERVSIDYDGGKQQKTAYELPRNGTSCMYVYTEYIQSHAARAHKHTTLYIYMVSIYFLEHYNTPSTEYI